MCLRYGLAMFLGFIGVKLVVTTAMENSLSFAISGEPFTWAPHFPT
ncbi:MAG: hypothetical protein WAX29_07185 [Propionibacterium sp.]